MLFVISMGLGYWEMNCYFNFIIQLFHPEFKPVKSGLKFGQFNDLA
jgi:hypothetical protein